MAETFTESIAPDYVGEDRINLKISSEVTEAREGEPVLVVPDYSDCLPDGASLPLVYTVTDPDGTKIEEKIFTRVKPGILEFTPTRGGKHLVRIGEKFHNRWFGSLVVDVVGDERIV